MPHTEEYLAPVRALLVGTLALSPSQARLDAHSPLLGSLAELDSLAVINLITALESHFGFQVDDDEINARHFATLGSLCAFVAAKMAAMLVARHGGGA
jgi:acyl carrier protein